MTEPVVVGYIGGAGRSGSTLISRALHRVPGVVNVGEIRLWSQSIRKERFCSCGELFVSCAFWRAVGERAFGGWGGAPVARAETLRRRVERDRNLFALRGAASPGFTSAVREYSDIMDKIFVAVRDESGAQVVIDNSKFPSSAFLRRRQEAVELRVIHLVRDSHGVAYSWSKEIARADSGGLAMARFSPSRSAAAWSLYNLAFEFLERLDHSSLTLRYEDVIDDPRTQVGRVAEFLGVPVGPGDLAFISDGEIDLVADHGVWGNPMRVGTGPRPLVADDEFRTALARSDRLRVTALTWPGRRRYGYNVARSSSAAAGVGP